MGKEEKEITLDDRIKEKELKRKRLQHRNKESYLEKDIRIKKVHKKEKLNKRKLLDLDWE